MLEPLWHDLKKNNPSDAQIIKGFINAAVALELHKKGRKSYTKALQTYQKHSSKIASKSEYIQMKLFLDAICYNLEKL